MLEEVPMATPSSVSSRPRIPSIDGIRAFSILCVLWSHAQGTRGFPIGWAPEGITGVQMFFVISGFIITTLLLREEQDRLKMSLPGFYRRRAGRILPALVAYLLVVAVMGMCNVFPFDFYTDTLQPLTFTMGFPWWPRGLAWEVRHTWSLSIEEQFYLVWPPLLAVLYRPARFILPLAIAVAGPFVRVWIYQHPRSHGLSWTLVCNADIIAWGCLLATAKHGHPDLAHKIASWRPELARFSAVAVLLFAPWYFHRAFVRKCPELSTNALSVSAQSAAIAFLILSLIEIRKGAFYHLLNFRVVVWIGLLSYSLYLWQQLFLADSARWWNRWPVNIVLTFTAATFSYFVIEQPARKFVSSRSSV
jgi:peptidoglycan/LPS O-acetylase OafA/YrhL